MSSSFLFKLVATSWKIIVDSLLLAGQTQQGPGQLMVDNHWHFDRFAAATRHHNLPRQIGKPKTTNFGLRSYQWMIISMFLAWIWDFAIFLNIAPFTLYAFVFLSFCFQLLWYFFCLKRMEMFKKEDKRPIDVCGLPQLWLCRFCVFLIFAFLPWYVYSFCDTFSSQKKEDNDDPIRHKPNWRVRPAPFVPVNWSAGRTGD